MERRICRLCLGQFPIYFSLLNTDILKMLESLTSIKITEDDELSTVTCTKCLLNLKLAFTIQQNILKVEEKLRDRSLDLIKLKNQHSTIVVDGEDEVAFNTKICDNLCKICGVSIDDNLILKHTQEHFQSLQTCNDCKKTFKNIREYRQHLDTCQQNTEEKTYSCKSCDLKFRYASLYDLHMNNHKEKNSKQIKIEEVDVPESDESDRDNFPCNICLKAFQTEIELANHTHNLRECPICKTQVSKNSWREHVKNHVSGPKICEKCGATLKSAESLRGHMAITHSKKCFKCEDCNVTFKVHYNYLKHRKSHTGEKDHACDRCGKRFVTKYYLNKHIRYKHLKLRPHVCEFCKRAFSSKNALMTHRRQHTNEKPYRCELCNQGFRQNVSLRAHRKSKHDIIEPKTCACRLCGKEFSSRQAIHSHMRKHNGPH